MLGQVITGFAIALIGLPLTVFGLGTMMGAWTRAQRNAPFYNSESLANATALPLIGVCCTIGGVYAVLEPLLN